MTREYVMSQSARANAPGMFTSVVDPPQLLTVEWEERTQHVDPALLERDQEQIYSNAKHSRSTTLGSQTGSWMGSGSETVQRTDSDVDYV
jgi:hypothetical protein